MIHHLDHDEITKEETVMVDVPIPDQQPEQPNAFNFKIDPEKFAELSQQIKEETQEYIREYKKYKQAFFSQLDDEV
jgi:YbbR domain-containing protein